MNGRCYVIGTYRRFRVRSVICLARGAGSFARSEVTGLPATEEGATLIQVTNTSYRRSLAHQSRALGRIYSGANGRGTMK